MNYVAVHLRGLTAEGLSLEEKGMPLSDEHYELQPGLLNLDNVVAILPSARSGFVECMLLNGDTLEVYATIQHMRDIVTEAKKRAFAMENIKLLNWN